MKQTISSKTKTDDETVSRIVSELPEAGRIDPKTGLYVLPKEWDNPEDDVYEKLVRVDPPDT